jgi:transcription-repair coupling factor (superfamily II helicase)
MHSDQLEEVMTAFINGETDVLLSTTIIESGLDIPNANTIIIDRADRFGLGDLYQLRGRVGRYKHQAYAYLLLPRHAGLLTDARKRLSAIKQYSSLGSGFKIAMRDLEIRGAGNLLGAEQSGYITAVGFELYCQLLKQSVSRLKGETVRPLLETQMRLDFLAMTAEEAPAPVARPPKLEISVPREVAVEISTPAAPAEPENKRPQRKSVAGIPASYIPEAQQRIEICRKLAQAAHAGALRELKAELRDRFGPPPPPVELALQVTDLKLTAAARGITIIETQESKLMLTRGHDYVMAGGKFPRLKKAGAAARLQEIKKLVLAL